MSRKCLVYGCPNKDDEGLFIQNFCAPCFNAITTGDYPSEVSMYNFIKRVPWLYALVKHLSRTVEHEIIIRGELDRDSW